MMCDNNTVPRLLFLLVLVSACGDHDSILNQIHQHNNGYTGDDTTGWSTTDFEDSHDFPPGSTGSPETTDPTDLTSETDGHDQGELYLSVNVESLTQAGSLLLTVDTDTIDSLESLDLFVSNVDSNGPVEKITWPLGQDSLEYIVDHPDDNGTKEFRVLAQTGSRAPLMAATTVVVDLPASGSLNYTWVGAPGTTGKAVVVQPGKPGFHDRMFLVGNTGDVVTLSEVSPLGAVVEQGLAEDEPLDVTSATMMSDGDLVLVGSVGEDAEVRLYHKLPYGSWVRYWVRNFPDTVLHGAAAIGEDVIVVGEAIGVDGFDATAWQLTESGGTVFSDTLSVFDDENAKLDSSIHSVSVRGQSVVCAGYVREKLGMEEFVKHPRLFSFSSGALSTVPRPNTGESEYVGGGFAGDKFIAWGRADETSFRSTHKPDLSYYTSVEFEGEVVAAGHRHAVGSLGGRLAVFRDSWLFQSPDVGSLTASVLDRFGMLYATGHVKNGGHTHAFVVAIHP